MAPDHRTRSPLRERERSISPKRGGEIDYGHDADKHVRHIARTRQLTAFAGQKGTPHDWSWVLQGLVHRRFDRGTGCPVDILPSIIFCDGSPEALYRTHGGTVVSSVIAEDEGCMTFAKAMAHLRPPKKYFGTLAVTAANTAVAGSDGANGAVAFTSSGEVVAIKTADVDKIRKAQSTPPAGTEALVLLVPTKAPCAELLLSIQHTFALDPCAAKPVHRSYRLVILNGIPKRIPCQSSTINRKVVRLCKQVLRWIEAYSEARVLRLVLEVVEDIYGHLCLVRSSECFTTKTVLPYNRQRRSPSPSQSKTARLVSAKGIANELSILRDGHGIGESAPSPSEPGMLETGSTGRVPQMGPAPGSSKRAQTAMSPAEAGGSQGTLDAEEWGFKKSESPSRGNVRRPQTVSAVDSSVQDIGVTFQGFAGPGEHDPREVGRTPAAGRALGTSQLGRMCQGDFCNTDLLDKIQQQARFEREETGNGSLVAPSSSLARRAAGTGAGDSSGNESAFRRKILKLDEAALQDYGVLPDDGGLMKAKTTQREHLNQKGQEKEDRRGGGGGGGRRAAGGGGRSRGGGTGVDAENAESTEWNDIPFSWVVRGRQESHLIDQQLRRYRRGNKEPFIEHLSGLGESSVSLGALFPGTYYQSVRVCGNCYRVYSMVDEARTKTVKRLDAQAAEAAAFATGGGFGTTTTTLSQRDTTSNNGGKKYGQPQPRAAKRVRGSSSIPFEQEDGGWNDSARGSRRIQGDPPSSPVFLSDSRGKREGEQRQEERSEASSSVSGESLALMRAQAAIDGLTRGDICELRSFAKPPAAVNMVVAALMIALTGHGEPTASGWLSAKRYMTNVDKLFATVAGLDLNSLRVSQTRKLEAYVRNPAFRPGIIACVSLPASKICAWVLGVLEAHRWRTGRGHTRIDTLGQAPELGGGSSTPYFPSTAVSAVQSRPHNMPLPLPNAITPTPTRVAAGLGPAVYPFPPSSTTTVTTAAAAADLAAAGSGQHRRSSRGQLTGGTSETRPTTTAAFNSRRLLQPELPPQAWVPPGAGSGSGSAGTAIGTPSRAGTAPAMGSGSGRSGRNNRAGVERDRGSQQPPARSGLSGGRQEGGRGVGPTTTRAGRAAAKRHQDRVGERLANATAAAPDPAGFERSEFLCADGVTLMPYAVVGTGAPLLTAPSTIAGSGGALAPQKVGGQPDGNRGGAEKERALGQEGGGTKGGVLSFVVVHDFFDTLEKTFLLFKPLVLKYPGCQVLCFNSPGQAGTRLPPEPEGLLTNVWIADRLDELMQHVDNMGEMPLSDRPFHLLGFGNGASIAAAFACKHASKNKWRPTLRSLVCINGFATVDAQLSAVLHSAQRAFQCFPPERPDLPISFWSRFVFSEGYLKSVGSDLALNILCAVANPLGAEGMLRIVRGALKSRDLTKDLKSVALPIVLVQSTENMLIDAANVDPFLEGRRPRHVWSHQLRLRATATATLADTGGGTNGNNNKNSNSSTISCLGPGGEQALFESLSSGAEGAFVAWVKGGHEMRQECKCLIVDVLDLLAAPGGQTLSYFQRGAQARRPPGGRVGIAAKVPPKAGTAAVTAGSPVVEKTTPGGGFVPSDVVDQNGIKRPTRLEEGEDIGEVGKPRTTVELADTAVEGFKGGPLGEKGGSPKNVRDTGCDGRKAAAAEGGQGAGLTYGYASLRKIREREPLPEFPRSCGRRTRSPTSESTSPTRLSSSKARLRSRALTAPASPGKKSRNRHGHDHGHQLGSPDTIGHDGSQGQGRGPPRVATTQPGTTRQGFGEDAVHCESENGGGVATLEAAVADFDIALRDHRDRRRGLEPGSRHNCEREGEPGGVRCRKPLGEGEGSPLHNTAASNWLDEEAMSWATIDLGIDNGTSEQQFCGGDPENDVPNETGGRVSRDVIEHEKTGDRVSQEPPQPPPPPLGDTNVVSGEIEDRNKFAAVEAVGPERIPPPDNPKPLVQDGAVKPSEATRSPPAPEHAIPGDDVVVIPRATISKDLQDSRSSNPPVGTSNDSPLAVQGVAAMAEETVTKATATRLDGTTRPTEEHSPEILSTSASPLFPPTKNTAQVMALDTADIGRTSPKETGGVGGGARNDKVAEEDHPAAPISSSSVEVPPISSVEDITTTASATPPAVSKILLTPATTANADTAPHDATAMAAAAPVAAPAPVLAPQTALAMESPDPIATPEQRTAGDWMKGTASATVDSTSGPHRLRAPLEVAEAEAELAEKVDRLQSKRLAAERDEREALDEGRAAKFGQERIARAERFADEDKKTLAAEERRLAELRRDADLTRRQRGAEFQEIDQKLVGAAIAATTGATPMPVRGMRPQHFIEQEDLPAGIKKSLDRPADKVLDEMEGLAARAKAAGGGMTVEALERVEQKQRAVQVERMEMLHGQTEEEKSATMLMMAVRLQMFSRQKVARMRVARLKHTSSTRKGRGDAAMSIQSLVRGHLSRKSVRRLRRQLLDDSILGGRVTAIQRMYRGRLGRLVFISLLKDARCRVLQKAARGFLGRLVATRKRALLARCAARASSATKLQSAWRGKMARDSYLSARCSWLASREIQRLFRGHLGRRATRRRREWQAAGPGPERLKLGLRMIEDTKVAFVKQQGEIAALNRAQEKAEARVSSIHHQLTASESELSVLEGEMAEIDHIERELVQLTHERDLISRGITGAAGIRKTGKPRGGGGGDGGDDDDGDDSDDNGSGGGGGGSGGRGKRGLKKEDAYALEMQLQLKRAEREQRRLQLSVEFESTFADVSDKKRQLDRLSAAVSDIEATRLRKSREFGHMQRNLMELLSEQKRELDIVREKGVQLETAAATSAAAAAATAQRARDHEAKAAAMYGQTEELMKFQFMSMSLSYFSSLNMMKQMRDINADTTTAAVAGSADAAAAAAASAAAASIPSLKHAEDLGGDAVSKALAAHKGLVKTAQSEIKEAESSQLHPFPTELVLWTVDDVCRWLDTLQLGEYKQAFREGKVDGSFLGELRESDLMDSIGMEHKLHLKKLLLARQKLTPLSAAEQSMASSVRREESATATRDGIPDIDTAFSQARHGKKKRLEETLNTGFDINAEDALGNTLLLVAVQQLQMPVVEFLVRRGAAVNHRNASGNTALHFAMSYDTSGKMGEYLINNGADDTIENKQGLSPYDGI